MVEEYFFTKNYKNSENCGHFVDMTINVSNFIYEQIPETFKISCKSKI